MERDDIKSIPPFVVSYVDNFLGILNFKPTHRRINDLPNHKRFNSRLTKSSTYVLESKCGDMFSHGWYGQFM